MHRQGERLGLGPGHLGHIAKPAGMHESRFVRELSKYRNAEQRACGFMLSALVALQDRREIVAGP